MFAVYYGVLRVFAVFYVFPVFSRVWCISECSVFSMFLVICYFPVFSMFCCNHAFYCGPCVFFHSLCFLVFCHVLCVFLQNVFFHNFVENMSVHFIIAWNSHKLHLQ